MKKKSGKADPAAVASKKQKITALMQKGMTTPMFDGKKTRPKKSSKQRN